MFEKTALVNRQFLVWITHLFNKSYVIILLQNKHLNTFLNFNNPEICLTYIYGNE